MGYRGYGLGAFTRKLESAGFNVARREFTAGCRSVFLVCHNPKAQAPDSRA